MSHLGEQLSALVDGELDPSSQDRVLSHIAQCEACRFEAEMLRQLKRRLCGLDAPEPSMDFVGRLAELTGPGGQHPPQDGQSGSTPGPRAPGGPGHGGTPLGQGWPHPPRGGVGHQELPGEGGRAGQAGLFRRLRTPRLSNTTRYGFTGACVLALTLGAASLDDPSTITEAPGAEMAVPEAFPLPLPDDTEAPLSPQPGVQLSWLGR